MSKSLPKGVILALGKSGTYKDNELNRLKGRVGKTYHRWVFAKAKDYDPEEIDELKEVYEAEHEGKTYPIAHLDKSQVEVEETELTDTDLNEFIYPALFSTVAQRIFGLSIGPEVSIPYRPGLDKKIRQHLTKDTIMKMINHLAKKYPLTYKVKDADLRDIVTIVRESVDYAKKTGGLLVSPFRGGAITDPELLAAPLKK